MNQSETQNSISSAVFGLQVSLRNLQQKWTCLQRPTNEANSAKSEIKPTSQPNGNNFTVPVIHFISIIDILPPF